jgi:uncharacterized protein (DUF1015 family)
MAEVNPFRAARPAPALAARVIAPPYDVLTAAEAAALAADPLSFVHVTRSEVDLPHGADPHSAAAYARARQNLDAMLANGTLVRDEQPRIYVYAQRMGGHTQAGFIALASVEAYDRGEIRKHELTRPDKEDDRTHHMETLDAQVGLVFLAYRAHAGLRAILDATVTTPPAWRVQTEDDVEHAFWALPEALTDAVQRGFAEAGDLYVADGHHRSAAASRVHARRGDAASAWFIAGMFPDDRLQILDYNRVVFGAPPIADLLDALAPSFEVHAGDAQGPHTPSGPGEFTMYAAGRWYALRPRPDRIQPRDPVAALDVSVLQDHVLGPLLGIHDPRRSERIRFVGGIRGVAALTAEVDAHPGAVAFHLHPTSLAELFAVADAGQIMPPKSTWFEPKLREGVVVHLLR